MAIQGEWGALECPSCGRPFDASDSNWLKVLVGATRARFGIIDPSGWRKLSCGHRVDALVDRTRWADRFSFQLTARV